MIDKESAILIQLSDGRSHVCKMLLRESRQTLSPPDGLFGPLPRPHEVTVPFFVWILSGGSFDCYFCHEPLPLLHYSRESCLPVG